MPERIFFDGDRVELLRLLRSLPALLAGRGSDGGGIARRVLAGLGVDLLTELKLAYIAKSRGGTDEAGITWQPLAESTIRSRRKGGAARGGNDEYGDGQVEILRDTGRLLNSLSPMVEGGAAGPDQLFTVGAGRVRVGTTVEYAKYHQDGGSKPGRPPRRPIVWGENEIPAPVMRRLMMALRRRIIRAILELLRR